MRQFQKFLTYRFHVRGGNFKLFYSVLFGTTILSYIDQVFVFLPKQILGFNWSGIAWLVALLISITLLPRAKSSHFPLIFWMPWIVYLILYLVIDFTFIGLQLTLQYLLPLIMGYLAATFRYSTHSLLWVLQGLAKTSGFIFVLAIFYKLTVGYSPYMAQTPMYLLIMACIILGFYFYTSKIKYLVVFGLLFTVPFLNVTRMAMLVFVVTFIGHFANKRLSSRIGAVLSGGLLLLGVLNSKSFQEKTFYDGSGGIDEIQFNYYDNANMNSSGRKSWQDALAPGLESSPIFGNGPRRDAVLLGEVIDAQTGEAHNDYMSVRYNYGFVGLVLLLFGFGASFLKLFQMSRVNKHNIFQLLILTNLTLFIGFFFFMYSDNILKYTIWFPNYFFVLMGICFSIYKMGFEIDGRL